ncbi:hypothetical protein RHO12_11515 [Orbus sturtevantii]|uniref:hypothetical protein n=1 Tax=Orbus sturtevantii TaxID=3074109 RepID=UPI00370DC6C5
MANFVEKLQTNRKMTLDLNDYTESMSAMHHILTKTPLSKALPYVLPPFTHKQLQMGLQTPWTAELIGRLAINYESEWYADENLSKWNEIDELYQKQTEQKRQAIIDELTKAEITAPVLRQHACRILDKNAAYRINEWQLEKQHRIKPSLWWDEVAKAQAAKSTTDTTATTNQPVLSNLAADGKAWHLHPVGMLSEYTNLSIINIECFVFEYKKYHKNFSIGGDSVNFASEQNLRHILYEINKFYLSTDEFEVNKFKLAYMFATARHEAYHYLTSEFFSKKPEIGSLKYFNKYDPVLANTKALRNRAIANGNTAEGDGYKYRGRGLVHLTWKNNYAKASTKFDIDFVGYPDKAADFEYSVPIMIWGMEKGIFTNKKLSDYINNTKVDYENARKIINGVDRKEEIANNARIFEKILNESMNVL